MHLSSYWPFLHRAQIILHPEQDRVLTIRENARLQGFPDYYKLFGPIKQRYSFHWPLSKFNLSYTCGCSSFLTRCLIPVPGTCKWEMPLQCLWQQLWDIALGNLFLAKLYLNKRHLNFLDIFHTAWRFKTISSLLDLEAHLSQGGVPTVSTGASLVQNSGQIR